MRARMNEVEHLYLLLLTYQESQKLLDRILKNHLNENQKKLLLQVNALLEWV